MTTVLQLSATRWLNLAQVVLVDYDPAQDQWHVRLCGQAAPMTLEPDEGAALAYYLQQHASREAYKQTQRQRRDREGTAPPDGVAEEPPHV
jgi:hypothetical protein